MKNIKIFCVFLFTLFLLTLFITGCKDKYEYVDYEKLEADELKLLERFYESKFFEDSVLSKAVLIAKDTLDTLDLRKTLKLFMLRTYRSNHKDTIKTGQVVGYRYRFYYLNTVDSASVDAPLLFTNRYSNEPDYYVAGNYTTTSAAMSYGIDYAIRNMFLFDRCTVIIPSSIGAQSILGSYSAKDRYKIIIAEIEVTYHPRN